MRQPAVFFGHGSPMNALGGPYAAAWRDLGLSIGKPAGVVMGSAHWETDGIPKPSMISVVFPTPFARCSIRHRGPRPWPRGWPT